MKNYIVRTIAFATLSLGLASAASAQVNPGCSNARLAGSWGYTKTGTLYLPTGAAPFASIGTLTFHADGNVSGKIDVSVGGSVGKAELIGGRIVRSMPSGDLPCLVAFEIGLNGGPASAWSTCYEAAYWLVRPDHLVRIRRGSGPNGHSTNSTEPRGEESR